MGGGWVRGVSGEGRGGVRGRKVGVGVVVVMKVIIRL